MRSVGIFTVIYVSLIWFLPNFSPSLPVVVDLMVKHGQASYQRCSYDSYKKKFLLFQFCSSDFTKTSPFTSAPTRKTRNPRFMNETSGKKKDFFNAKLQ